MSYNWVKIKLKLEDKPQPDTEADTVPEVITQTLKCPRSEVRTDMGMKLLQLLSAADPQLIVDVLHISVKRTDTWTATETQLMTTLTYDYAQCPATNCKVITVTDEPDDPTERPPKPEDTWHETSLGKQNETTLVPLATHNLIIEGKQAGLERTVQHLLRQEINPTTTTDLGKTGKPTYPPTAASTEPSTESTTNPATDARRSQP